VAARTIVLQLIAHVVAHLMFDLTQLGLQLLDLAFKLGNALMQSLALLAATAHALFPLFILIATPLAISGLTISGLPVTGLSITLLAVSGLTVAGLPRLARCALTIGLIAISSLSRLPGTSLANARGLLSAGALRIVLTVRLAVALLTVALPATLRTVTLPARSLLTVALAAGSLISGSTAPRLRSRLRSDHRCCRQYAGGTCTKLHKSVPHGKTPDQ